MLVFKICGQKKDKDPKMGKIYKDPKIGKTYQEANSQEAT